VADADALLAAILAEPDDDGPRLVYADWLEEHGEPARAEFVRVQLALAGPCPLAGAGCLRQSTCEHCWPLRRREGELLEARAPSGWLNRLEWVGPVLAPHAHGGSWVVPFRRGFVESVACTAADWLAHADGILAAQPVEQVRLADWPESNWRGSLLRREVCLPGRTWVGYRDVPRGEGVDYWEQALLRHYWPRITFVLPELPGLPRPRRRRYVPVVPREIG
jgi:uncharacterized protein (TIGR02996 family)